MIRFRWRVGSPQRLRWIALILLIGGLFRIHAGVLDARFHADEAYFAGFAMRASLNGDWLLTGNLDKPPLAIYISALSMSLFAAQPTEDGILDFTPRQGEFAARLPSVFASLLLIAVVYRLAGALYRERRIALTAALFVALSPFAIAFGGSAFTDMPMLLAVTLALWFAARGRPLITGVALAVAVGCKLQAVYALPLVLMLLWNRQTLTLSIEGLRTAMLLFAPLIAGLIALSLWDAARGGTSVLALAAANNAPGRLIRSDEVVTRIGEWLNMSRGLLGAPTVLVVGVGIVATVTRLVRQQRRSSTLVDMLLLTYVVAYVAVHWLIAFDTYDRYLLPILIPLALISARGAEAGLSWLGRRLSAGESGLLGLVIVLSMLGSAWNASQGTMLYDDPQSSFLRQNDWIEAAVHINAQPLGTIVYDYWYGWELDYYLGAWTDKRRVYFPTPQALAAGAHDQPDPAPRLLVAPLNAPHALWLDALTEAGFTFDVSLTTQNLLIYQLTNSAAIGPSD